MTGLSPVANGRDDWGAGARPAHASPPGGLSALRNGALASAVIAVACVLATASILFGNGSAAAVTVMLTAVICGVMTMTVIAYRMARTAGRQVDERVRAARLVTQRGQAELRQMVDRLMRGEQPAPLVPVPAQAPGGDQFLLLSTELEQSQYLAGQAVLQVAGKVFGGRADQRVEIFVTMARRMQSLLHREIELLDELESKVEDPDLLKGLFAVDHLATRLRRQSESLTVFGGSASRRKWTRQVSMHEVVRAGVAEVEHYSRVKVVPPVEGMLCGAAVTDVIHLIAEVVENATKFSAPETTVLLRAQRMPAGLAIEIEDRGAGMPRRDQQRINDLLADPNRVDVDELLRDGRIGLYLVAILARKHDIGVRLQNNIYGGTQATVVLPGALFEEPSAGRTAQGGGAADGQLPGVPRPDLIPAGGGTGPQRAGVAPAAGNSFGALAGAPARRPRPARRTAQAGYSPQPRDQRRDELSDGSGW